MLISEIEKKHYGETKQWNPDSVRKKNKKLEPQKMVKRVSVWVEVSQSQWNLNRPKMPDISSGGKSLKKTKANTFLRTSKWYLLLFS